MNRKNLIAAACAGLLVSCSPTMPRKGYIAKDLPGNATGTAAAKSSQQAQDPQITSIVRDDSKCLEVDQIMKVLNAKKNILYWAYLRNRDLVTDTDGGKAKSASWPGDAQTLQRMLVNSQSPIIFEMLQPSQLSGSTLVGSLTDITALDNCTSASFGSGSTAAVFDVDTTPPSSKASSTKQLTLISKDKTETRIYSVIDSQLVISVLVKQPTITPCNGKPVDGLVLKSEYILDFGGGVGPFLISSHWAQVLMKSVPEPPPGFEVAATAVVFQPAAPPVRPAQPVQPIIVRPARLRPATVQPGQAPVQTPAPRSAGMGGVSVEGTALQAFTSLFQQGDFSPSECPAAPTTPTPGK